LGIGSSARHGKFKAAIDSAAKIDKRSHRN